MGVTQSTVSGRVKALEKVLGQRLFIRSRAGTQLTLQGMRFQPHARGLRLDWNEARHAVSQSDDKAATVRIGIQHDMVSSHFGELIHIFRTALPKTTFFFEADYSTQMCADLTTGAEDLAIVFSPRFHPDLYFEHLGEVTYEMISTETDKLKAVRRETYVMPHFSDAFPHAHAALHPSLSVATLSIGQNAAMVEILKSMGGTAYVLADSAEELVAHGICRHVTDAQPIQQAVFSAVNHRHRHRPVQRRLFQILRRYFRELDATRRSHE